MLQSWNLLSPSRDLSLQLEAWNQLALSIVVHRFLGHLRYAQWGKLVAMLGGYGVHKNSPQAASVVWSSSPWLWCPPWECPGRSYLTQIQLAGEDQVKHLSSHIPPSPPKMRDIKAWHCNYSLAISYSEMCFSIPRHYVINFAPIRLAEVEELWTVFPVLWSLLC